MSKFQKIGLAISCFIPLYIILAFKNTLKIIELINENFPPFDWKSCEFIFNVAVAAVWMICIIYGLIAIFKFRKIFLDARKKAREYIVIDSAENITGDYYFTYFALFVLTFFTIDPTTWTDVAVLIFLMLFIVWVYVSNEMWFINPMLNVLGYKSFKVTYSKPEILSQKSEALNRQFEIRVFSKDYLNKESGEKYCISYSSHDFSVCYFDTKKFVTVK